MQSLERYGAEGQWDYSSGLPHVRSKLPNLGVQRTRRSASSCFAGIVPVRR
jgi:hypothetical protein